MEQGAIIGIGSGRFLLPLGFMGILQDLPFRPARLIDRPLDLPQDGRRDVFIHADQRPSTWVAELRGGEEGIELRGGGGRGIEGTNDAGRL